MESISVDETAEHKWYRRKEIWQLIAAIPGFRHEAKAALNGAIGDRLELDSSPLATPMALLSGAASGGNELKLDEDLAEQIAGITSNITIFVHSLMSTERIWSYPGKLNKFGKARSYGDRLIIDAGVTPIYVRYNTGLHISTNGKQLAEKLEQLVKAWPVKVKEINLIGYSMGGLLSRSAAYYGSQSGAQWVSLLKRMYLVGAPLRGAPLEQFANIVTNALWAIPIPITRVIAKLINQRSEGIKDLRHGYLVDEDWQDKHPDAISLGREYKVPLIPHVEHYIMAGNLFSDEHHPGAKVLGDILVTPFSAKDEGFDGTPTARAAKDSRVFSGLNHLDLVNHDDVYEQILKWWFGVEDERTTNLIENSVVTESG